MAIPDFQSIMLPLLRKVSDGQEWVFRDLVGALEDEFQLTPEERAEMLPSGGQRLFRNRVGWARFHLVKAKLLDAPRRGIIRITDRGKQMLATNPARIYMGALSEFPEYQQFRSAAGSDSVEPGTGTIDETQTPEEAIETAYGRQREALASDLLERIRASSPRFFEELVVRLLVRMGYGGSVQDAGSAIGRTGDEGIDGVIKEDKLGLDVIYVQAKRWEIQFDQQYRMVRQA